MEQKEQWNRSARLLKALGHPMRIAMVEYLFEKPWCVCNLASELGLKKSAASKHLALLRQVGVIDMERNGTQVICSLKTPCVVEMLHCADKTCCGLDGGTS